MGWSPPPFIKHPFQFSTVLIRFTVKLMWAAVSCLLFLLKSVTFSIWIKVDRLRWLRLNGPSAQSLWPLPDPPLPRPPTPKGQGKGRVCFHCATKNSGSTVLLWPRLDWDECLEMKWIFMQSYNWVLFVRSSKRNPVLFNWATVNQVALIE